MLHIYQALSFQGVITGGKTNPWLVLINVDGTVKPYVIKLFDQEKHFEGDALSREVIGNVLAKQFNLNVPQCALIDMNNANFEHSIFNTKALDRFRSLNVKIAFGTEYLYPSLCFFSKILDLKVTQNNVNLASVFAFDVMIRNTDRNFKRPNLLIHSKFTYLIDFESCFQLRKDALNDVLVRTKSHTYYYMHVFHSILNSYDSAKKSTIFNEFINQLEIIDFNLLNAYIDQLRNSGFIIQQYQEIINYLEAIRQNRLLFNEALKSLIHE